MAHVASVRQGMATTLRGGGAVDSKRDQAMVSRRSIRWWKPPGHVLDRWRITLEQPAHRIEACCVGLLLQHLGAQRVGETKGVADRRCAEPVSSLEFEVQRDEARHSPGRMQHGSCRRKQRESATSGPGEVTIVVTRRRVG